MYLDEKFRILGNVDVSDIKKLILELPEFVWNQDHRRKVNKNFSDSHSVWLRNHIETRDNFLHTINNIHVYENKEFKNSWINLSSRIEKIVNGSIVRSCIIRLAPNHEVHRHTDGPFNVFRYCHRIVLPIIHDTTPYMYYDDDQYVFEEGVIYDTNGYLPHWAKNNSSSNIYTAVLDILPVNETAVSIQEHPNTPETYKWLNEIGVKKTFDNCLLPHWEKILEDAKQK
jgi:hypothetical protein